MAYKLLGFAVWRAGKWYLSRRLHDQQRKLALAGLSGLVLAGVAAALRSRNSA